MSETYASLFGGSSSLPQQKIPYSQKNDMWRKSCMDYYISFRYTNGSHIRSDRNKKQINYDLFNGKINMRDVQAIVDPLATSTQTFSDTFMHYDKISEPIRLLIGEETQKPDNAIVISEAPDDLNRKQKQLKDKILGILNQSLMADIDPKSVDPNKPIPKPEEVIKYEKYSPSDIIESKANKMLNIMRRRLNTKFLLTQGFKDVLISGEEIYWTGILNGEPHVRKCNTMNTTPILDDDTCFIDDAIAVIEDRLMAVASILDEYGDLLTNEDIRKIEQMSQGTNGRFGTVGGYDPVFEIINGQAVQSGSTPIGGTNANNLANYSLRVTRVEWMSMKNVGTLKYTDVDSGEKVEKLIDESFKSAFSDFKKYYEDAEIEWFWINEAWEGIRIGIDVYAGIQPKKNQRRRLDNPYYCKLGYTGFIYDATNSRSVSLVDRLKPYQYLYDVISYKLQLVFASDMGKILLMDLAQIPRSEGIDVERWMYYLKEMKIAFINSFEEGNKGSAVGKLASSHFNQFQAVDLSLTNAVQQYVNYLDFIQNQIFMVSGVTPQRMGTIKPDELVGNVEAARVGSSLITEHLYDIHFEVRRRLYIALIEVAKIAYKDGMLTQYVNDDMGIEMLHLDEFEFENSEFNVFVSNLNKDSQIKAKLDSYVQVAMEQGKADLSDIIETVLNDSPKDIVHVLKQAEERFYQNQQEQSKSQQEHEAQLAQAQQAHEQFIFSHEDEQKQKDRDLKQYEIDRKSDTLIEVQQLANYGKQMNLDLDQDNIPDALELAKNDLERHKINSQQFIENQKLAHDKSKHNDLIKQKDKEINGKLAIEQKKVDAIKEQNKSQEKINKENNEIKRKELQIKKQQLNKNKNK